MNDIDDLMHALSRAVKKRDGGISAMATELGVSTRNLYSKLDPNDELHLLSLPLFVAILHRLSSENAGEVLDTLSSMFGYQLATRSRSRARNVAGGVIHAMSEFGDVVRAVESALEDGRISDEERRAIIRESAEARKSLIALENTLYAGTEDGQ